MPDTPTVHVTRQDSEVAVWVGGDADPEGQYDAMFAYGRQEDGTVILFAKAFGDAVKYANQIAKKLDAYVDIEKMAHPQFQG